MFLSTQSVSRPKRDSIYSFLRHFGPFGSITTAIFSENPGCSNLAKTRFLKKEYSHASTDHQVQFSIVSSIFQRPWHTQGLWKIAKKPYPVVKFGCGSVRKFAYFFQKMEFKFSKNREKYKKIVKIPKKLKMKLVLRIVWYIFFQILFLTFSCSKKYFSEYCSIFKKSVGLWYPPSMGLPWKI